MHMKSLTGSRCLIMGTEDLEVCAENLVIISTEYYVKISTEYL